jgi:hypothetical protein
MSSFHVSCHSGLGYVFVGAVVAPFLIPLFKSRFRLGKVRLPHFPGRFNVLLEFFLGGFSSVLQIRDFFFQLLTLCPQSFKLLLVCDFRIRFVTQSRPCRYNLFAMHDQSFEFGIAIRCKPEHPSSPLVFEQLLELRPIF